MEGKRQNPDKRSHSVDESCQYGHIEADSRGDQNLTVTTPFTHEFFLSSQHAWTNTQRGPEAMGGAEELGHKKAFLPAVGLCGV